MKKRTLLTIMILSLVFLLMLSLTATSYALTEDEWIDETVDKSVSKITGTVHLTGTIGTQEGYGSDKTVYDKQLSVTFSNPKPADVQTKIDEAVATVTHVANEVKRLGRGDFEVTQTESTGKVWDNRKYETVPTYVTIEGDPYPLTQDSTNENIYQYDNGSILIIWDNDKKTLTKNGSNISEDNFVLTRTHYATGEYGKETFYRVLAEGEVNDPAFITNVSVTIDLPKAGTTVSEYPVVTPASGSNFIVDFACWIEDDLINLLPADIVFTEGKSYHIGIILQADDGYAFSSSPSVNITNGTRNTNWTNTASTYYEFVFVADIIIPTAQSSDPASDSGSGQQQPPAEQPPQQQQQEQPQQQQQEDPPAGQQQPPQEEQPQTEAQPGQQEQQEQQSDERIAFSKLKKVKLKAVSKKKIKVSWKKLSKKVRKEVQQIQIQISTDPEFKTILKEKFVSSKKTSYTVGGLKKNTKYYIRIRAYTEKDGLKYVSEWVKKSKKTKKK